jgi:regulator of replication initiation timing
MKARTPIVVTFGGPHFMTVEPLPKHVEALHEEKALLRLENAKLRGSLADAKDALRAEADRRQGKAIREDVAMPDRRVAR